MDGQLGEAGTAKPLRFEQQDPLSQRTRKRATPRVTKKNLDGATHFAKESPQICHSSTTIRPDFPEGDRVPARTVIIVDDNAMIRRLLCDLFTRAGDFDVCGQAENGREAIEKAQQLHPDLIVTDLSMPVMNGLEATRILKKLMPAVPVIIYTAHSDPFIEDAARSAGASAVMSKSEAVTVLIGEARSLLDQIAA
jgi:CheY-like chemotaxis protein